MADRAKKKEKQRLKREKKQRALRKISALTPLQLISRNPRHLQCMLSTDWQQRGLASLFVFGTAMDGRHAMSVFLIDTWCIGLKDAWGRKQISRDGFDSIIEKAEAVHQIGRASCRERV